MTNVLFTTHQTIWEFISFSIFPFSMSSKDNLIKNVFPFLWMTLDLNFSFEKEADTCVHKLQLHRCGFFFRRRMRTVLHRSFIVAVRNTLCTKSPQQQVLHTRYRSSEPLQSYPDLSAKEAQKGVPRHTSPRHRPVVSKRRYLPRCQKKSPHPLRQWCHSKS